MDIIKEKTEFDYKVEEYIEAKHNKAYYEKMEKELKAEVVALMNDMEEVITDFHKVTNKEQIKDGVDLEKLRKEYPEAYKACFKPSIFPVLRAK